MGRSQVLFNRKKAGRGRGGGRSNNQAGRGNDQVYRASSRDERDSTSRSKTNAPQQHFEVDRSLSYSDPLEDASADQSGLLDQTLNSLLETGTGTRPSAASDGTASGSFFGLLVDGDSDILVPDDISRVSEVSYTSLNFSALNSTLMRLSLQERYKIPQHLIETLNIDETPTVVTPPPPPSSSNLPPSLPRSPRLQQPARLTIVTSGTITTAYDGDDDSDAILRSRRSERDEGSTLPSNAGPSTISTRVEASAGAVSTRKTSIGTVASRSFEGEVDLVQASLEEQLVELIDLQSPPESSAARAINSPQRNVAVAADLQPVYGEIYMQNSSAASSGADGPGSASAVASRATTAVGSTITPSDTARAVAGSSFASSNPERNLILTDTLEAVAGSASSLAYSAVSGGLRYNDSMLPAVRGVPVSSAERSVLLPSLIVSASPRVAAGNAPVLSGTPRYISPTTSNSQRSLELSLSPGRNPTCPIDLSDVDSTAGASQLEQQSPAPPPFSVPDGRIRAMYVDTINMRQQQQTSPAHSTRRQSPTKRTVFSGSGVTDAAVITVDAIEHARRLEASTRQELRSGGGEDRRRVGFEIAAEDSSTEPDSAAAVIAPISTRSGGRGGDSNMMRGDRATTPQQQRKLALEGLSVSGVSGSSSRSQVRSPISSANARDASITPVAAFESRRGGPVGRGIHPPQIHAQATTPRTPKASSSAKPPPSVFFPDYGVNEKREDEFDDWLDSALESKTFDKTNKDQEDLEKEALSDWLDSVIP